MIQNVLSGVGGIGNFGVISILLFGVVFTGMLIWAFRQKKADLDAISRLPLEDTHPSQSQSVQPHSDPRP